MSWGRALKMVTATTLNALDGSKSGPVVYGETSERRSIMFKIDTLAMSITPVAGTLSGKVDIALPVKPYLAIRLRRIDTGTSSM